MGLQKYNGKDIIYDQSGNPVEYYNGWEMSWNSGRMLESMTDGENVISYKYNKDGIRIGKTVNGIETEYLLDENNKMMGEKCGEDIIWYLYDSRNEISGFEWNATNYYYVKNGVGDVQGITDKDGNVKCLYYYDIWGKITEIEGNKELGEKNPIKYRGYYYDEETKLYYLNTRYYDPEVKRFLNRDMLDNETNLYQYCYNNPVIDFDVMGTSSTSCQQKYIFVISNPFGCEQYFVGSNDTPIPYTGYIAKYILNKRRIYFNCYMWALGRYETSCTFYDPGYKTPNIGLDPNKSKAEAYGRLAMNDLIILKYSIISFASYMPSVSSLSNNKKLMAVRTSSSDYYFMKYTYNSGNGYWPFKAGMGGPTLKVQNGIGTNSIGWMKYYYDTSDKIWKTNTTGAYTSTIYYITYK